MSFLTSMGLRWALRVMAVVFVASTTAQSCYYPDGSLSDDSPCSTTGDAACCGSSDFCLSGGLCLSGAVVMRKTCTDKTWASEACSGYCKNVNVGAEISITPCTSSSFVCGLNGTQCADDSSTFQLNGSTSIVLRASQVASLVQTSLESQLANATSSCTATATASPAYQYTSGQMAGLGCALGFPLALGLVTALLLLRKEKAKHSGGKNLMYKLPDNHTEYTLRPPGPVRSHSASPFSSYNRPSHSRADSVSTVRVATPVHMRPFGERYEMIKNGVSGKPTEIQVERHELDTALPRYDGGKHASMVHEMGGGEVRR